MQCIYACISIQVTGDHAEHQENLERGGGWGVGGGVTKVPNASGKAAFWQSFVY